MAKISITDLLRQIEIDKVAERLGMELRDDSRTRKMALCPFHDDKTPSLLIDMDRGHDLQHFHCFACGAHGSAIDLVKERLQLDFHGAVEWLASNFTVRLEKTSGDHGSEQRVPVEKSGLERGYSIYKENGDAGRLKEWAKARKYEVDILSRAGFVYAPKGVLSNPSRLSKTPLSERLELMGILEDAFLVRKLLPTLGSSLHIPTGGEMQYTDTFVGDRVIFPIYDERKRLVGLGGRAVGELADSSGPKYLFTRNFPKAKILYRAEHAFNRLRSDAKSGIKELQLYLCEGFLDALRLETLGLPVVAVMGSSISKEQAQLLKEVSDSLPTKEATLKICICFDRDEAGLKGASVATLTLLDAGLEVSFVWPTALQLQSLGVKPNAKDPDDYLSGLTQLNALGLLHDASCQPGVAVLANQFGIDAGEVLDAQHWENAPRSRKYRAFEKAKAEFRKVKGGDSSQLRQWIHGGEQEVRFAAMKEWLAYHESQAAGRSANTDCYLTNSEARLNHARLLAYSGSRRGELLCDEPRWERLDIAATAFNVLLTERLISGLREPIGPYDAVWVPRSFGGDEPRLKVMPQPEDLIVQQYLLNELLTERWDDAALGPLQFSQCIPAVRYYREERKTLTTGFAEAADDPKTMVRDGQTLSFAYQIDMDVVEGRQPASDQGMFRPFHECWRDFMQSLKQQAAGIGHVHVIRLDVSRYYDRLRRRVVRDNIQPYLQKALESIADDAPEFSELLRLSPDQVRATDKAATVVDQISDLIFGYPYMKPDTGHLQNADPLRGIPQGPVISAWIGSISLFPVDREASKLMERYNTDGQMRVGYARYVDDIVLLADSASILEELREVVDRKTRSLDLTLLAKADAIPPMSAQEFADYANKGRALEASGPAWEPPIIGDGEAGWEFWSATPSSDRQSALQLLSNLELYKSSIEVILQTVKTAFLAMDLRATELAKGARLLWYAIAADFPLEDFNAELQADDAWDRFDHYWNECTSGTGWQLNPERNGWESPILFALEGIEKLIDFKSSHLHGLSTNENLIRQRRILSLAKVVLTTQFKKRVFSSGDILRRQTERRFALLEWKASKAISAVQIERMAHAERSQPVREWLPFEWFHDAIERLLLADQFDVTDPLAVYLGPYNALAKKKGKINALSYQFFGYLLPTEPSLEINPTEDVEPSEVGNRLIGLAVQTLVAAVPRVKILQLLSSRTHLLGEGTDRSLLLMPPLPGISQKRMIACRLSNDDTEHHLSKINKLESYEITEGGELQRVPQFIGAQGNTVIELVPTWNKEKSPSQMLVRLGATLPDSMDLRVLVRLSFDDSAQERSTPRAAAALYRAIVQAIIEYEKQNVGLELIPAWPYITSDENSHSVYLLCEGVQKDEVGNRAFVKDGGRALRTVEVPIYEAHLWRVGMALSDYIGLYDDIAKFSTSDSEVPLDEATLGAPARYVLRSQFRKLRGAFANSQIGRRVRERSSIPASIERALELLEQFPSETDRAELQLKYLLATEVETAAMRIRYEDHRPLTDVTVFLRGVAGRVLGKLPMSIGEPLSSYPLGVDGLRRDLVGVLTFARRLWTLDSSDDQAVVIAWNVLRAGIVSMGVTVALQGMLASLRSHGSFSQYQGFDFPAEWEIPPAAILEGASDTLPQQSAHADGWAATERMSLLELLRRLVAHLGHRMRVGEQGNPQLSAATVLKLKEIALTLARVCLSEPGKGDDKDWPFVGITDRVLEALDITFLESICDLMREFDQELSFEVVLVKEQSYGFNPQTRRFTDSKSRTWDIQQWMVSQFPMRSKHVEELLDDGRVLRVWSEVYDRVSGRLLSVSVLGEPFASIAIRKVQNDERAEGKNTNFAVRESIHAAELKEHPAESLKEVRRDDIPDKGAEDDEIDRTNLIANDISLQKNSTEAAKVEMKVDARDRSDSPGASEVAGPTSPRSSTFPRTFRRNQQDEWQRRKDSKNLAHVRVALLQWDLELSYVHPMVEACPRYWPLGKYCKKSVLVELQSIKGSKYERLIKATERGGLEHNWKERSAELPSWAEHRRRKILERAINACDDFGVDLLVLPEYSMRRETVKWLRRYLLGKQVAVLAGTYMEFQPDAAESPSSAKLNLLWPVPRDIFTNVDRSNSQRNLAVDSVKDEAQKGYVLQLSRRKKYRSVGLNEFIRPETDLLRPLFIPSEIVERIGEQFGRELGAKEIVKLLALTRLPLKHFLELICSEIFLVTSPANYPQMAKDYQVMQRRFGFSSDSGEVVRDLHILASMLAIGGDGHHGLRRSILIVPAATTRTADYWVAGQAGLLAAGTTTVFCNGTGRDLRGGSCFIGRESWKNGSSALGYIPSITPYHGWSKGIYYNSKDDPLGVSDQALVIADIDPHNMLEGKPRPQMLPVPLQLVAYLPIAEVVETGTLNQRLCNVLPVGIETSLEQQEHDGLPKALRDTKTFWDSVALAHASPGAKSFDTLSAHFSDPETVQNRAAAVWNDSVQQPFSVGPTHDLFASPALYDWIDVDLSLAEGDVLPLISIPPWRQ